MKNLFYNLVEGITENITGIQNGEIHIWEFDYWMKTSSDITLIVNLVCLLSVILLGCATYKIVKIIKTKKQLKEGLN